MNVSNLSLIIFFIFIILFYELSFMGYNICRENLIKKTYKNKIEYALSSSMIYKYDFDNPYELSKLSTGSNFEINHEKMYEIFVEMLNKNFGIENENNQIITSKYLDKYIVMKDNGIIINYKNNEDKRVWSDIIPYSINYKNKNYIFTLNDDSLIIDNNDLKKIAIINTIRRNMIIENKNSILFNIPYIDGIYSSVDNQSVFATFIDFPLVNMQDNYIAVFGGNEIKSKNVYYINSNNKYEKININNITDEMTVYDYKYDAGKYYYPEI